MSRVILHTRGTETVVDCPDGEKLMSVLCASNVHISAPCGGKGTCGKCRVTVEQNGRKMSVLACQTEIFSDTEVYITDDRGGIIEGEAEKLIQTDGERGLGVACDLGTTTLVLSLYDMSSGKLAATKRTWNEQRAFGADVISRIRHINENGIDRRQSVIKKQIDGCISEMCSTNGINSDCIKKIYISGNTVMQHIYCGLNPRSIASYPYKPQTLFFDYHLKSDTFKNADIVMSPCVSGYVGGDITAGLTCIADDSDTFLYLDIGTNGEMALSHDGKMLCCSVATGPAFEGAQTECGMPAVDGAISSLKHENGIKYTVIGGKKPVGICGSAIVQLTAILINRGIITDTGRLCSPDDLDFDTDISMGEDADGNGIVYLTDDKSVYFSASDVRKIQLAKASLAAGIKTLVKAADITYDDIKTVYISGGFGKYLDANSAVTIGMIPAELRDKITYIGNASLKGTVKILMSEKERKTQSDLRKKCEYIELSLNAEFRDEYVEQMPFYYGREE